MVERAQHTGKLRQHLSLFTLTKQPNKEKQQLLRRQPNRETWQLLTTQPKRKKALQVAQMTTKMDIGYTFIYIQYIYS